MVGVKSISKFFAIAATAFAMTTGAQAATTVLGDGALSHGDTETGLLFQFTGGAFSEDFTVTVDPSVTANRVVINVIDPNGLGDFGASDLTLDFSADGLGTNVTSFTAPQVLFNALELNAGNTIRIAGNFLSNGGALSVSVSAIPVPAAGVLFGSALLGAGLFRRMRTRKNGATAVTA